MNIFECLLPSKSFHPERFYLDNRTYVLYRKIMENTSNIPVGESDIPCGFEIIELFGAISGRSSVREMFDSPTETPAHNLVTRTEYTGPEEPFYVPALCRVVGLMINGEVCAGFPSPAEEERIKGQGARGKDKRHRIQDLRRKH